MLVNKWQIWELVLVKKWQIWELVLVKKWQQPSLALKSAGAAFGGKQWLWPPPDSLAPTLCWYYNNLLLKVWFFV